MYKPTQILKIVTYFCNFFRLNVTFIRAAKYTRHIAVKERKKNPFSKYEHKDICKYLILFNLKISAFLIPTFASKVASKIKKNIINGIEKDWF